MFKWINGIKYDNNNCAVEADRGITAAVISPGTKTIGYCAFHNCTELTTVILPDTLTGIDAEAFFGCTALKTVVIPHSVTSIGSSAFAYCINLKSINLPNHLVYLGINAFRCCPLQNAPFKENGLTYWKDTVIGSDREITSARIKDGVKAIGDGAFVSCSGLVSVTIPDSVKEIGCNAIYIGPLFESEGHGYETTDYYKLDSRLGDNDDLKKFVKDCHNEGITLKRTAYGLKISTLLARITIYTKSRLRVQIKLLASIVIYHVIKIYYSLLPIIYDVTNLL